MKDYLELPGHYPSWWCCPVGTPRIQREMIERFLAAYRALTAEAQLDRHK